MGDSIVGFLKVKQKRVCIMVMKKQGDSQNGICYVSSLQKSCLVLGDEVFHVGLKCPI